MLKRIGKTLVVLSLPFQMVLLQIVADHPQLVEKFYSGLVYKYLSQGLRLAFGGISLPLGQFVFYSLIAGVLVWIGKLVKKRLQKKSSKKQFALDFGFGGIAIISSFYFLFNVMWGLNYYRQPAHELVKLDITPYNQTELKAMSLRLIERTNQSRRLLSTDSLNPLRYTINHEKMLADGALGYEQLEQSHAVLSYNQSSVKRVLAPELMSYFGLAGIYFPFTGEANVNMDPPPYLIPETVCHEMAHQIGIASEAEANFVAFLACQQNPDPIFQYSGNLMAMHYTLRRLYREDSTAYYQYIQTINPGVICDLEASKTYWDSFNNPIEIAGRTIHDLFLKANSQAEGVSSYKRVVELLIGEFRKNGLVYVPGKL